MVHPQPAVDLRSASCIGEDRRQRYIHGSYLLRCQTVKAIHQGCPPDRLIEKELTGR